MCSLSNLNFEISESCFAKSVHKILIKICRSVIIHFDNIIR